MRPPCLSIRIFVCAAALAPALCAEELKLPVTADNSICCHESETGFNMGKAPRIKMKGNENMLLFAFDPKPLQGKLVTKAVLHLKATAKNVMVRKVGFSTVATPWPEGSLAREGKAAAGDSCFESPEAGSGKTWAGPGSDFLGAVWGRGGTIWTQSFVTHDEELWFGMEFDGRIMEACAAGLSHGVLVSDDNGQTKNIHKDVIGDGNFGNNYFFSREQNSSVPYFTVTTEPAEKMQAGHVEVQIAPWPWGADLETGGLEISWPGPKDAEQFKSMLGFRIRLSTDGGEPKDLPRWMHPSLGKIGERVRAHLKGQPAGAKVTAIVEVVARGGGMMADGKAHGEVSGKLAAPAKLEIVKVERAAGDPPANATARVWALPDGTKANPVSGNVLEESGVDYEGEPAGSYSKANAVWSGKEATVHLSALRGEWAGFQLVCQNLGAGPVEFQIAPGALQGPAGAAIPASALQLSRLWYQKVARDAKKGEKPGPAALAARNWYADPMLPLQAESAFKVPDEKNAVAGQTNQTVYAEFFVPKDAVPGTYEGKLEVRAGTGAPLSLKVKLELSGACIPAEAHFAWSMNAYSSPGRPYGKEGTDAFLQAERRFYTMSHLHRTCLAILHYSHSGNYEDGTALPLAGQGQEMRVSDWSAWDKRFGPLLDGSAFQGTPREGVPLEHFYLNLSEHYPTKMAAGYKWNDSSWEEHWKVAGPVEEGFSPAYREQWVAVAAEHMKHFAEKGYKTHFQIYLNDKYFYKQHGKKGKGSGVSFWLLDEPNHCDDFSALAFFGKLHRQAQAKAGEAAGQTLYFRVDDSRPEWSRDLLDRVVDLHVSGSSFRYHALLEGWRDKFGQRIWTYGGSPASTLSALGLEAQALDLYGRGVDGFVPWLTLGADKNWTEFETTSVFYPGKSMGLQGPCASLRLKAYRRGEQDVEYVWLLAQKRGLFKDDPSRLQVRKLMGGAIQATKKLGLLDVQGAVTETFSGLRPEDFEQFRRAIAQALTAP